MEITITNSNDTNAIVKTDKNLSKVCYAFECAKNDMWWKELMEEVEAMDDQLLKSFFKKIVTVEFQSPDFVRIYLPEELLFFFNTLNGVGITATHRIKDALEKKFAAHCVLVGIKWVNPVEYK